MARTHYAISWLYGEFRIACFKRDEIIASWASPTLVDSHNELVAALAAAAEQIDLSIKGDVSVVHEHDLHSHEYLEVPSMKARDLEKSLHRRVLQDKSFPGDADWCYHRVSHQGGTEGVLLHLLPQRIVVSTIAACTAVGLAPKKYVPLTEIVSGYLPTTEIESDTLALVVACFKTRTEIIIALGDGEALFVRELNYGLDNETVERLISDLNRTLRYARQQLRRTIDLAWVMGDTDESMASLLKQGLDVTVHFDDNANDPYFWARWATRLSGKRAANFISVLEQNNITGDVVRRVAAWSTVAVSVAAIVTTIFTGGLVAHRAEQMSTIETRSIEVRELIGEVEAKLSAGRLQQQHLQRLRATSRNMPSLIMVNLSQLTPSEVTLTDVSIERTDSSWIISLQGRVFGDMRQAARVLAGFEDRLSSPPWSLNLSESFTATWMQQFAQGKLEQTGESGFRMIGELR